MPKRRLFQAGQCNFVSSALALCCHVETASLFPDFIHAGRRADYLFHFKGTAASICILKLDGSSRETGHTSKCKDGVEVSLCSQPGGGMSSQRDGCDRPTARPTVCLFCRHLPSHSSSAQHRLLLPLSDRLPHLLPPLDQVRSGALLVLTGGLFQSVRCLWKL